MSSLGQEPSVIREAWRNCRETGTKRTVLRIQWSSSEKSARTSTTRLQRGGGGHQQIFVQKQRRRRPRQSPLLKPLQICTPGPDRCNWTSESVNLLSANVGEEVFIYADTSASMCQAIADILPTPRWSCRRTKKRGEKMNSH